MTIPPIALVGAAAFLAALVAWLRRDDGGAELEIDYSPAEEEAAAPQVARGASPFKRKTFPIGPGRGPLPADAVRFQSRIKRSVVKRLVPGLTMKLDNLPPDLMNYVQDAFKSGQPAKLMIVANLLAQRGYFASAEEMRRIAAKMA